MPYTITLTDPRRTITVVSDVEISLHDVRIKTIADVLESMHRIVPLQSFVAARIPGQPLVYNYDFMTVDQRTFSQRISFTNGVTMTFIVPQGWRLEEFVPHRTIRDAFVNLVVSAGLERVEAIYGV